MQRRTEKRKVHVLIVEDVADHVDFIKDSLTHSSYDLEIDVVNDLKKASLVFTTRPPDIAVVDLMLSDGQDGSVLLPGSLEMASFPIIVLTAKSDERLASDAIERGAIDFVVKSPENYRSFYVILHKCLKLWDIECSRRRSAGVIEANIKLKSEIEERKKAEERFWELFNASPLSHWEEDFEAFAIHISGIIERLGASGLTAYLVDDSNVLYCASLIKIVNVNKATRALLELDDTALPPATLLDVVGSSFGTEAKLILDPLRREFRELGLGAKSFETEILYVTPTAKHRYVHVRLNEMKIHSGIPQNTMLRHAIVSVEDFTERKQLEELKLQVAREEGIRDLITEAAHKLKNPAYFLTQDAKWLNERLSSAGEVAFTGEAPDRGSGVIDSIQKQASRIFKIVGDLNRFLSRERHQLKMEKVDLSAILDELSLSRRYEIEGIKCECRVDGDAPCLVSVDRERLNAIIEELIGNAFYFTPKGGSVYVVLTSPHSVKPIDVDQDNGFCMLTVEDTGPGVPVEMKQKIFEPFQSTRQDGTGLGLAYVKRYCNEMGLTIREDGPGDMGRGARFRIKFNLLKIGLEKGIDERGNGNPNANC